MFTFLSLIKIEHAWQKEVENQKIKKIIFA